MSQDNDFKIDPVSGKATFKNPPRLPNVENNEQVGSGRVTALLGYGGMANVYEIWDPQLEVYRAVKIIKPDCTKEALERFYTEIKITAKLNHPNIIDIHSVGIWSQLPYIEMERVKGITLREIIDTFGALPPKLCTAVGILICRALTYAHSQKYTLYGTTYHGIIHRDLKPGNIMICPEGLLKLMDFGIARPIDASFHTLDNTIVGTIQYMPPELLQGEKIDVRTDIYALGATLYEILTGVNAFPESNFGKLVQHKQKNQFRPLNGFKILIPDKLRKLIHKCMQQDKNRRVASAQTVLRELEKVHKRLTSETPEFILNKFCANYRKAKYIPAHGWAIPWHTIVSAIAFVGVLGFAIYFSSTFLEYLSLNREVEKITLTDELSKEEKLKLVDYIKPKKKESKKESASNAKRRIEKKSTSTAISKKKVKEQKPVIKQATAKEKRAKPKQQTLLEKLTEKHGTNNPVELASKELQAGNAQNAYALFIHFSASQNASPQAIIYKIRVLQKLTKHRELTALVSNHAVKDGEFLLAKAKLAYNRNSIAEAKQILANTLNSPVRYTDYTAIKQQVFHYKALCASKIFDTNPTEQNYLKALEEWRNLGALFSSNRTHYLFKKYREETRRIGEKYRANRG